MTMDNNIPVAKDTVKDCLSVMDNSLQFVIMSLSNFDTDDDEKKFLNASEWSGLRQSLHCTRVVAEECFNLHLRDVQQRQEQAGDQNDLQPCDVPESMPVSQNPVIDSGMQGTLGGIINTLQFLSTVFEHVTLADDEKLLSPVEVLGFINMLNCIKVAAVDCLEQFDIEPPLL